MLSPKFIALAAIPLAFLPNTLSGQASTASTAPTSSPTVTVSPIEATASTRVPSALAAETGISVPGTRLLWESPEQLAVDLDRIKASGVSYVRIDIPWTQIEGTQGRPDWTNVDRVVAAAQARDLQVHGIVTTMAPWARPAGSSWQYGPTTDAERAAFATFARQAAARYDGRIRSWEVWNEPNLDQFWAPRPSSTDYTKLIAQTYPAIKAGSPSATVMTGGTGGAGYAPDIDSVTWYSDLYRQGARPNFDAVAVHPYTNLDSGSSGEMAKAFSIRNIMEANGDGGKKIWATETGAPTHGDQSVTPARAAELMAESDAAWRSMRNRGPVFWYTLQDTQDPTREGGFGLFTLDGKPKPAYGVLQDLMTDEVITAAAPAPAPAPAGTLSVSSASLTNGTTLAQGQANVTVAGTIRADQVILAVRSSSGANYDLSLGTNVNLTGTQKLSGNRTRLPKGTYTYRVAYLSGGKWTEVGNTSTLTVRK